jgi:hypothetical protein
MRTAFIAFAALMVCVGCSKPAASPPPVKQKPRVASVTDVVEEFGRRMKNVSTLAPHDTAAAAIRKNYSQLVAGTLLQAWTESPERAAGRKVSSPWPDRIEIQTTSAPAADRAVIEGAVVEVTSTGEAGRTPVRITLQRSADRWMITGYSEQPAASTDETPVQVVEQYYAAIGTHDFARAYAMWGGEGPPGQTLETFAAGFGDTESVQVTAGAPSRVEAAAGSRYIQVPVVVNAKLRSGVQQHFIGSYTLRRSVVDGATAAQRRWHLYRASLRAVPGDRGR